MFDCLDKLIGLNSVSGTATSGLYLDMLPDITLGNSEKIVDENNQNVDELFADVRKRTILRFKTLFQREINICLRINEKEAVECLMCENKELLAVSLWYLFGVEMLQQRLGSNRINRYTTTDRTRTKELQEHFMDMCLSELHTAVLGINLEASKCFSDINNIEGKNLVGFVELTP